ncbi:MAG: FxsA family protein [Friedmanniella sp.]
MRLRGGLPLAVLLVLVVALPIFEVWLLIQVGDQIGVWPTVGILVLEAVLGAFLMRREGSRAWRALTAAFETGRVPTGELANAALVLVGGLLLMLPGFATDIIGFLFLLPMTRPLARKLVAFFVARRISRLGLARAAVPGQGVVIEGETVDGPASGQDRTISGEITDR